MSKILESTECTGFSIENNKHNSDDKFLIIDVDIFNKNTGKAKKGWNIVSEFIKNLQNCDTFECWNSKTEKYNKKFIFKDNEKFRESFIKNKSWHKYIELLNKATIYTLSGDLKYHCNFKDVKQLPEDLI